MPQCHTKISTGFGKEAIGVNNREISFKWCWLMPIVVGDLNHRRLLIHLAAKNGEKDDSC